MMRKYNWLREPWGHLVKKHQTFSWKTFVKQEAQLCTWGDAGTRVGQYSWALESGLLPDLWNPGVKEDHSSLLIRTNYSAGNLFRWSKRRHTWPRRCWQALQLVSITERLTECLMYRLFYALPLFGFNSFWMLFLTYPMTVKWEFVHHVILSVVL